MHRRKRYRRALVLLLCLPLSAALVLSVRTLSPTAADALQATALAGTFLAAPKSAVAAMGQVFSIEDGSATPEKEGGGFWTELPTPAPSESEATPAEPQTPKPENAMPVVLATYTGKEDNITVACGNGLIKNVTDLPRAEVAEALAQPMPFQLDKNSKEPQVLIMHTHTTESYQSTEELWYDPAEGSRSTDVTRNMAKVGDVLTDTLNAAGIVTLHDITLHDYPSYNGSYDRSKATVESYLAQYPSIKVVLDIHRDAIEKEDGTRVRPVTTVNGEETAQVMIICGADNGNMGMPNYKQNLRFAGELENAMASRWPEFARPVLFDYRNYNQQLTTGSLLIEVGGHANTLEEACHAAKLVGEALASLAV